ncbi:hypothetical protein ANCDUO_15481 [Ancylostoma duodenale]|uniref:Uncharacterized protein n=1 Tax=Ancylostoma duodenale TaxID=51022 RepID=A0A0C2G0F6_9BILA|nr:hypothetical protein ANCDUO_15481 [Ancylostoma duodenale]
MYAEEATAVAEAVSSMRDASVRRRFEKEVELTLAWEAEKMIVERFAGDCSLMGVYSVPSTSAFDLEPNTSFYEEISGNGGEFMWSQSSGGEQNSGKRLQTELNGEISNSQLLELSKGGYSDPSGQVDVTSAAVIGEKRGTVRNSPSSDELSKESVDPRMAISATGMDSGKENLFICATHGVKTHHLVRVSNPAGSLACKYCPFRTNKTFNFNRHMRRFHPDKLWSVCAGGGPVV